VFNFIQHCKNYHNQSGIHEQSRIVFARNLMINDFFFTVSAAVQSYNNNHDMPENNTKKVNFKIVSSDVTFFVHHRFMNKSNGPCVDPPGS